MPTLTIRGVPHDAHDALRRRARLNNRSMEAEARQIIDEALFGPKRLLSFEQWQEIHRSPELMLDGPRPALLLDGKPLELQRLPTGDKPAASE